MISHRIASMEIDVIILKCSYSQPVGWEPLVGGPQGTTHRGATTKGLVKINEKIRSIAKLVIFRHQYSQ